MGSAKKWNNIDDERLSPRGPNHYRSRKNPDAPLELGDELGEIVGSATGEADHDVIAGGWEGTDDATSTSPCDMVNPNPQSRFDANEEEFRDAGLGRASGGGMALDEGGVSDIKGTPVEDSRNWEDDPIESEPI